MTISRTMRLIKDFINLIFYGNFWIALCATSMALQSQYLWQAQLQLTPLINLIFCATLFVYALHRIVGISRLKEFLEVERYAVIYRYRKHIRSYALLGGLGALFFFFHLPRAIQLELLIPGIISLGYVWPILTGKRRLRDINHLKIFLIALVFAWVTVRLPALESGQGSIDLSQIGLLVERALFIFSITLPFDIRDLAVDKHSAVKTIPSIIGLKRSKQLAYFCLLLAFLIALANADFYKFHGLCALAISYLSTAYFVSYSDSDQHDYFFTGLIDGTMIIQFLLVVGAIWLAN